MTVIDLEAKRKDSTPDVRDWLLQLLEGLRDKHYTTEDKLFSQADHLLFPAHLLYISVLSRSLEQLEGFLFLFKKKQYGNCIALSRMQMDSIMRFYGVLITEDMHETANELCKGVRLNTLKDRDGNKMTDGYLNNLLSKANPDKRIDRVDKNACGFIHLSQTHFFQMLGRSWDNESGEIRPRVGSDYEHLEDSDITSLLINFLTYTHNILEMAEVLHEESQKYNVAELRIRYRRLE